MTRNCVIAGVGPGNGASFARRLSAAGYRVAMLARNEEYLSELSNEVSNSYAICCDVRDPESYSCTLRRATVLARASRCLHHLPLDPP